MNSGLMNVSCQRTYLVSSKTPQLQVCSAFEVESLKLVEHTGEQRTVRSLLNTMLAWMGGKRSKLKHARKRNISKPRQNSRTITEEGSKRPMASPANRTRTALAKRTKEDLHKQGGHKGKGVVSTNVSERGQASISSNSSDLEKIATSMMDEQEDMYSGDPAQLQGNANDFDSTWPGHLSDIYDHDSQAVNQLEASQDSKCTKGAKEERKTAVSLDLQAIKLPG